MLPTSNSSCCRAFNRNAYTKRRMLISSIVYRERSGCWLDNTRDARQNCRRDMDCRRGATKSRRTGCAHRGSAAHQWHDGHPIARYEGYYASVFYDHLAALGLDLTPDDAANQGRIDLTLKFNSQAVLMLGSPRFAQPTCIAISGDRLRPTRSTHRHPACRCRARVRSCDSRSAYRAAFPSHAPRPPEAAGRD